MNLKRSFNLGFLLLLLVVIVPITACADGVSPILNLFHKDTWAPASIVTLVIILVESVLLRWRIKTMGFSGILWRSTVINLASSITGSVLLLGLARPTYFIWDSTALILPLFGITLVTEIPLLYELFKSVPLSWKRAVVLGCGINLVSYATVFILQIGLMMGFFSLTTSRDEKEAAQWKNPSLLKQATGLIYSTESRGSNHGLRVFDPQTAQWTSLTKCPPLDPEWWDVKGDILAFVQWGGGDWKERHLVVARLPDFTTLLDIPPTAFAEGVSEEWQGVRDLAISPDRQKVAILFRVTDAVAPKDSSSYFDLGSKCRLIVIDLKTGHEITRASRWASEEGLCWLADSRRILFPSYDNEMVYQNSKASVEGLNSYGIGYDRKGQFQRSTFLFDLDAGKIDRFSAGEEPSLAVRTGQVFLQNHNELQLINPDGGQVQHWELGPLRVRGALISPSGDMVLAKIRRHNPFFPRTRLVLFTLAKPEVRHLIDDEFLYRVVWTVKPEGN